MILILDNIIMIKRKRREKNSYFLFLKAAAA